MGCAILTRTMERWPLGLSSYDRFFPNQDTLPKGGLGNLIVLPLQKIPRSHGNSVFVDQNFQPYEDQWSFLSGLGKMPIEEAERVVDDAILQGGIIGVRRTPVDADDNDEEPWTLPPSGKISEKPITDPLPPSVRIVLSNLIYIDKTGLPPLMINRLWRLCAFQNPEFYKKQALRLSTRGVPRIISCGEEFQPCYLGLPRGCLDDVLELFTSHGVELELIDERYPGLEVELNFKGELDRKGQPEAGKALLDNNIGVLCAQPAFGKTVVAAWLIAARKVNTLIMVDGTKLMEQWVERLSTYLDVPANSIGQIGGGKNKRNSLLDIGLFQSLNRKGEVKDLVAEYGQVIVDECHHVSAVSFERVMKQVKAKYVVGLTATPFRKDGHDPIITMQCGPIRFKMNVKKRALPFELVVIPRQTSFIMQAGASEPGIQDIYTAIIEDEARNNMIVDDVLKAVRAGRSPIILTERTEHVDYLTGRLKDAVENVITLRGGMGKKQRQAVADRMNNILDTQERVIVATGRYIGEGFDDARLDTLFLVMPISWKGRLQQYAGRIQREHSNKKVVQIYDYLDFGVPQLAGMYKKRKRGYKSLGYRIQGG